MERKALLYLGGGIAAGGALLLAYLLRAPVEPDVPVCKTLPPRPQPRVPAGWSVYSGYVSSLAAGEARRALSMPIGGSVTFSDDDGSPLGVLVMWHCHDPSEGVTPVGWHKGATLFRIG